MAIAAPDSMQSGNPSPPHPTSPLRVSPKSDKTAVGRPAPANRTLSGFRSRWHRPDACRAPRPLAMSANTGRTQAPPRCRSPLLRMARPRLVPNRSMTRHTAPSPMTTTSRKVMRLGWPPHWVAAATSRIAEMFMVREEVRVWYSAGAACVPDPGASGGMTLMATGVVPACRPLNTYPNTPLPSGSPHVYPSPASSRPRAALTLASRQAMQEKMQPAAVSR